MTKIIVDTDIGSDVDDAIALVYAVRSGLDIALITTVHGDTLLRAKIARKILGLLETEIPVAAGEKRPLVLKQLYWTGTEGDYFLTDADNELEREIRTDGVEALAECIRANGNNISILSIGPPTNIAKAFQLYPELAQSVNHIYMMGNAICCHDTFHLNYRAHNFKVDPHATDIVFNSGVPITLVTTDVCKQNYFSPEDLAALGASGNPLQEYVHMAANQWLEYSIHSVTYLYDPLVVHHLLNDNCTEKKTYYNVRVTTGCNVDLAKILKNFLNGFNLRIKNGGDEGEKKW